MNYRNYRLWTGTTGDTFNNTRNLLDWTAPCSFIIVSFYVSNCQVYPCVSSLANVAVCNSRNCQPCLTVGVFVSSLANQMRLLNYTQWLGLLNNLFSSLLVVLNRVKVSKSVLVDSFDHLCLHKTHFYLCVNLGM